MSTKLQITTFDKLMVIPLLLASIAAAIARLITSPFSQGPKANTRFKDTIFAFLRTFLSHVSPATEQWLNASSESNYLDFAKRSRFEPSIDTLKSGLKVFWLGSKDVEKVILYCHGGGYCLSCSPGHFAWLSDLQKELSKSRSISVAIIGYTLAPRGQYPVQLQQAAESLAWLLDVKKAVPSNIILAGDSAGGNMALSLLSHCLHPHPEVPEIIHLSDPLAGAILISPWTKFATDDESVKTNERSDMVTAQAAHRWSSLFLGSRPLDNYNQPILADFRWFDGLELRAKDILIWAGGQEVLIDSIQATAKYLKAAHPKLQLVVQPDAAHEDFILDRLLGYKESEGSKLIANWIASRW